VIALGEMMKRSGATARQIDHWTRSGWIRAADTAHGKGNHRRWPEDEIAVAVIMRRLLATGLPGTVASRVARGELEIGPGILVFVNDHPSVT
jgi:MerR HTH family regulatory protein